MIFILFQLRNILLFFLNSVNFETIKLRELIYLHEEQLFVYTQINIHSLFIYYWKLSIYIHIHIYTVLLFIKQKTNVVSQLAFYCTYTYYFECIISFTILAQCSALRVPGWCTVMVKKSSMDFSLYIHGMDNSNPQWSPSWLRRRRASEQKSRQMCLQVTIVVKCWW